MKKKSKGKKKINKPNQKSFIIVTILLLIGIIISLIYWYFNRSLKVVIDYNNNCPKTIIYVKYNEKINVDSIDKTKLSNNFMDWYLVDKNNKGLVLSLAKFDFNTKITHNIIIKAIYNNNLETVIIKFDTQGGTKLTDIVMIKGGAIILPNPPSKDGYQFIKWIGEDENEIKNGDIIQNDITLKAVWTKK